MYFNVPVFDRFGPVSSSEIFFIVAFRALYLFVNDAANNWCFSIYVFANATVLSALHNFSSKWLSLFKTIANVDLEPNNLGLRGACSTDWASRAILKLRIFDGIQCASLLVINCIPLSNSELFSIAIMCSKDPPNVGLQPTNLGLRVPCCTDWAKRAILRLRKIDGVQWALLSWETYVNFSK